MFRCAYCLIVSFGDALLIEKLLTKKAYVQTQ